MERAYAEYAAHQAAELLAIDSPTGFTGAGGSMGAECISDSGL